MGFGRHQTCSKALAPCARVRAALESIARDEEGVTAIEYGLLAALIVVVASGSIALLGGGVGGMWTNLSAAIVAAL